MTPLYFLTNLSTDGYFFVYECTCAYTHRRSQNNRPDPERRGCDYRDRDRDVVAEFQFSGRRRQKLYRHPDARCHCFQQCDDCQHLERAEHHSSLAELALDDDGSFASRLFLFI